MILKLFRTTHLGRPLRHNFSSADKSYAVVLACSLLLYLELGSGSIIINPISSVQFSSVQFSQSVQFSCSLLRAQRATKAALRVGVPDLHTLSGDAAQGADVNRTAARARSESIIINYQFSLVQSVPFSCSLLRAQRAVKAALRVEVPDLHTLSGDSAEEPDVRRTAARARKSS